MIIDKVISTPNGNVNLGKIEFRELYKKDDSQGIILRSLTFEESEVPKLVDLLEDFAMKVSDLKATCQNLLIPINIKEEDDDKYVRLMPEEKRITGIYFISDNVKGSGGASNWLLTCDHPELMFDPLVRVANHTKFTWISDFRHNCHSWYLSGMSGPFTSNSEVLSGKARLLKSADKNYIIR